FPDCPARPPPGLPRLSHQARAFCCLPLPSRGILILRGGDFLNTEIICTIVTAGGVVLSSLISFFVARSTANREIRRMKLTWDREDAVTADKEFSSMSAAVAEYG